MTTRFWLSAVSVTALAIGMAGCGSGVGTTKSVAADSQACIDCHESQHGISKVTGENIVTEWKSSRHAHMNAASCNDCHETTPLHGGDNTCANCHGGGASKPVTVSDANGKCFKCHGPDHPADIMVANAPQHLHTQSGTSANRLNNPSPASYLSGQYVGRCRACHNPHDPTTSMAYNKAWATTGMANVNSGSRGFSTGATGRDFKMFGTPVPANQAYIYAASTNANSNEGFTPGCIRCHTTTGYVNFVTSGFMNLRPYGNEIGGAYTDKTKEVTACDACHADYNFKKSRSIGAVTLYFNYSATNRQIKINNIPTVFTDYGKSNVCVPCHAGRGMGNVIKMLDAAGLDFTNTAAPSGHDFSGAGTIAGSSGYEFPGREYSTSATVAKPNPHETINITGGTLNNPAKGPCVSCHMNRTLADSHLFMAVEEGSKFAFVDFTTATQTWIYSMSQTSPGAMQVASVASNSCSTFSCHVGTGTSAVTATSLTTSKQGYISALTALNMWVRLVRNVPVDYTQPYKPFNIFSTTLIPSAGDPRLSDPTYNPQRATTNYTYMGASNARDTMGAVFNNGLLVNEPGGYVHRPLYVRRLIYDSLAHLATSRNYATVYDAIKALQKNGGALENAQTLINATVKDPRTQNNRTISVETDNTKMPQSVADAAITWLYGRMPTTAAQKATRPGDPAP